MTNEREDTLSHLAEVFRTHGFDGASLSVITEATGLGKGSLYNLFPRGKEEMAETVLDQVSDWFQLNINEPLKTTGDPTLRIDAMFRMCGDYFSSHHLICLFGAFALGQEQDRFHIRIRHFFDYWATALSTALHDTGWPRQEAIALALEIIAGIQGTLVIARAHKNPDTLSTLLTRLQTRTVL